MTDNCPICGANLKTDTYSTAVIYCEYCGKFQLEEDFQNYDIKHLSQNEINTLKHIFQILPTDSPYRHSCIHKDNLKEILSIANAPKNLVDKINKLLGYYADKTVYLGEKFEISSEKASRLHFCKDVSELLDILKYLKEKKYINFFNKDPNGDDKTIILSVTVEGLDFYEQTISETTKQNQCFVAMWFNNEEDIEKGKYNMSKVYAEAIEPAIQNEERTNKINAVKINDLHYNSDVVDEIISQIRRSKFVVVDLTGYRGGVYYEAGFAEGLGLQVIYTCNKEWLIGNEKKNIPPVHFDTNHKNIIEWEYDKLEKFKIDLQNRINATIV